MALSIFINPLGPRAQARKKELKELKVLPCPARFFIFYFFFFWGRYWGNVYI